MSKNISKGVSVTFSVDDLLVECSNVTNRIIELLQIIQL